MENAACLLLKKKQIVLRWFLGLFLDCTINGKQPKSWHLQEEREMHSELLRWLE